MDAIDWLAIEGAYRAGQKSVRSIAEEHGIPETSLRRKAKKEGWTRDPAGSQREKVKAHFAGVAQGIAQSALRENHELRAALDECRRKGGENGRE